MKRKFTYKIWAAMLCACLLIQGNLTVLAEGGDQKIENDNSVILESSETVSANDISDPQEARAEEELSIEPASVYLEPLEDARTALSVLLNERQVTALVYLCDIYEVKAEADPYSETVCKLTSGDSVKILDVAEDQGRNIWFRITYEQENATAQGYIRRDYLAYSEERILDWESQYLTSAPKRRALSMARATSYPDVDQFPESYQDALYQLKSNHPNWIFVKMNTGLNWNTVVSNESVYGRNLIYAKTSLDSWMTGMYNQTWANASEGIIKYYLDPRNFLTESGIFQFEQLTYNPSYHTVNSIQSILTGTFMEGSVEGTTVSYAETFELVAKQTQVSPFLLASRVRQEQGVNGTSPLISGKYSGYEGYYNYYNIGASGKNEKEEIENGLKKAKEEGWNSRTSSLLGGARFLVQGYVFQGQDTLYLQKFDVDDRYNGLYWHQYMQNVQAPTSEAQTTYQAYKKCGVSENAFVFKIPIYDNMPAAACAKPVAKDQITLNTNEISGLPVSETVTLSAYINGNQDTGAACSFTSSDTSIATVDAKGVVTAVAPGTVTISCTKENAVAATCKVTVIKADTKDYTIPQLSEITYRPDRKLENIALPQGWSWVNAQIVPTVEVSGYSASYTPDSSKYNAITVTIPLTVKKADPVYTVPELLKGVHGAQLSSVVLPDGFIWENPETILQTLGNSSYTASYNPDVFNYNYATGIQISVQVVCEDHIFGEWKVTKEADCLHPGEKERVCTVCQDKQTETIEAKGHVLEDGICTVCGYQENISGNVGGSDENGQTTEGNQNNGGQTTESNQNNGGQTAGGNQSNGGHSVSGSQNSGNNSTANNAQSTTQQPTQSQPGTTQPAQPTQNQPGTTQSAQPTQSQSGSTQPVQPAQSQTDTVQPVQSAGKAVASTAGTGTSGKTGTSAQSLTDQEQEAEPKEEIRQLDLMEETLVPAEQLSGILGKNVELKIQMADGITWSVQGTQISYIPAEGIDMGIKLGNNIIPRETLEQLAGEYDTLEFSLAHEGEYGFTAELSLPVGVQYCGMFANLFYYNPSSGQLEFMEAAPVNEEGYAVFTFTHASDYAVVLADLSLEGAKAEGTDATALPMDSTFDEGDGIKKKGELSFSALEILVIAIIILTAAIGVIGIVTIVFRRRDEEEIIRPEHCEIKFRKTVEPDEMEWLE